MMLLPFRIGSSLRQKSGKRRPALAIWNCAFKAVKRRVNWIIVHGQLSWWKMWMVDRGTAAKAWLPRATGGSCCVLASLLSNSPARLFPGFDYCFRETRYEVVTNLVTCMYIPRSELFALAIPTTLTLQRAEYEFVQVLGDRSGDDRANSDYPDEVGGRFALFWLDHHRRRAGSASENSSGS